MSSPTASAMTPRQHFLAWVERQAARATPYCWPTAANGYLGKGLEHPEAPEALDCSGVVTCGLYNATGALLDWRADYNASRLFKELLPTEAPRPGDLAFYGAHDGGGGLVGGHVMVLASDSVRVVGASGGNRTTTSVALARLHRAFVQHKPSYGYRTDFRGWRALPLATDGT